MIPLIHDFDGERVLVFGGGTVGARKARYFASEADVFVLGPQFDHEYGGAECIRTAPTPADVPEWLSRVDPVLVVAATDDGDLNEAIETEAAERNLLCNRADRSGPRGAGSVVVPATVRDGPVVVSVSTSGKSPALSRYLREQVESTIENTGQMAELTGALRAEIPVESLTEKRAALRAVLESECVWKALDTESANPRQVATDVIGETR